MWIYTVSLRDHGAIRVLLDRILTALSQKSYRPKTATRRNTSQLAMRGASTSVDSADRPAVPS